MGTEWCLWTSLKSLYPETSDPCCVVCKVKNHTPGDKSCSGTAKQPLKHLTAFAGKKDTLNNFYPCDIKLYGMLHKSAEHAYQYKKAIQAGNDKVAERILEAKMCKLPFFRNYLPLMQYLQLNPLYVRLILLFNPHTTFHLI